MNDIQIFNSPEFGQVRTLTIDGNPWFVGKDVAEILGYERADNAIRNHVDEEDKLTHQISASGQNRNMLIINESGLYSLIFSSKLPAAKDFKHWVTSEVLPAIRKTGYYSAVKKSSDDSADLIRAKLEAAEFFMKVWTDAGVEQQYQLLALNGKIAGLELPRIAFKATATAMYDKTTIAKMMGMVFKSGKPHALAVGAIIDKLSLDEGEYALTPYTKNGHDGVSEQYTESVVSKVKTWLEQNSYPERIESRNKQYSVTYTEVSL